MNLNEWRKKRKETLTLPTGLEVEVKRVSLLDLLARGQIPNTLFGQIEALMQETPVIQLEDFPRYAETLDILCLACILNPPVAVQGDEQHLGLDELDTADKIAIFTWANRGAEQLAPFLPQPGSGEPAAPGG